MHLLGQGLMHRVCKVCKVSKMCKVNVLPDSRLSTVLGSIRFVTCTRYIAKTKADLKAHADTIDVNVSIQPLRCR